MKEHTKNWNYWIYPIANFFFYSLSTIGFGDLVPGDAISSGSGREDEIQLSFILCSLYLLLGMALIAMCFQF